MTDEIQPPDPEAETKEHVRQIRPIIVQPAQKPHRRLSVTVTENGKIIGHDSFSINPTVSVLSICGLSGLMDPPSPESHVKDILITGSKEVDDVEPDARF